MTSDLQLWIWLQLSLGCGSDKVRRVVEQFDDVESFYSAGIKTWVESGIFSRIELERLHGITPNDAAEIIDSCRRLGIRMAAPTDEEYPERLLNINDYPAVIYILGQKIDYDKEVCITMVGSRRCTDNGRLAANGIAYNLTKSGALVISGGATGIDSACHEGALTAKGRTVAFTPCGLNVNYLSQNEQLRRTIAKNGALISEYPPGAPCHPENFRIRNRLMTGISLGTVIVEADTKSGSIMSANHALKQGRDVFAVPGSIMNRMSQGTNKLIANGAKPVSRASEILEEYIDLFPDKLKSSGKARKPSEKNIPLKQKRESLNPFNAPVTHEVFHKSSVNSPAPEMAETQPAKSSPMPTKRSSDSDSAGNPNTAKQLDSLYQSSLNSDKDSHVITYSGLQYNAHSIDFQKMAREHRSSVDAGKAPKAAQKSIPEKQEKPQQQPNSQNTSDSKNSSEPQTVQKKIMLLLSEHPCHIDEIASKVGRPSNQLALVLMEMEMDKKVQSLPGRRFKMR